MLWKNDQFVKTLRKKHKSVIIMKFKNTWLKIIES